MKQPTILKSEFKGHASSEEKDQRREAKENLFKQSPLKTEPPKFLTATALKEWNRIVPVLKKDLPLGEADYANLVAYCIAYARIESAEREIRNKGVFLKTNDGAKKENPAIMMQSRAMKDLKMISTSLGMTMIERSRMSLNNAKIKSPSDPFKDLMEL